MVKIIKIIDEWKYIKNVSRTTMNKRHTEKEPTSKFKEDILIAEHSPIRELLVKWQLDLEKSWLTTHFVRHMHNKYVGTQREDRTGINRDDLSQGTLITSDHSSNAQNLIDMCRKRLCFKSHPETVQKTCELKVVIYENGQTELSNVLVPNCLYRAGCSEIEECGYYKKLLKLNPDTGSHDIRKRYNAYNEIFWEDFYGQRSDKN